MPQRSNTAILPFPSDVTELENLLSAGEQKPRKFPPNITIIKPDDYRNVQEKDTKKFAQLMHAKHFYLSEYNQIFQTDDILPDGWIIAGVSPDTKNLMLLEPETTVVDGYHSWHDGQSHAEKLHEKGYRNTRQLYARELKKLDDIDAGSAPRIKGIFNVNMTQFPYGKFWALDKFETMFGKKSEGEAWLHSFETSRRTWYPKGIKAGHIRCVRDLELGENDRIIAPLLKHNRTTRSYECE